MGNPDHLGKDAGMRTNSTIVAVASGLSILIGGLNAWIVAVEERDEPADVSAAANQQTQNGIAVEPAGKQGREVVAEAPPDPTRLLAEMASEHGYGLEPGQVLRRIAPPFPLVRATYYQVGQPVQAKMVPTPPNSMAFLWEGEKLTQAGMTFGAPYTVTGVIDYALKIKPPEIEGPQELLERRLEGDWVVRPGLTEEQFLKAFETILQKEFDLRVRLKFSKRVRTVYVARGKYHYTPVERDEKKTDAHKKPNVTLDRIEIHGSELTDPSMGGSGGGELKDFLPWVGRWINVSIIDEVSEPPRRVISWHDNGEGTANWEDNHDPERVLKNIAAQTGLTFAKELRVVRRVLVEPLE
ncbi:MAG TPA: hypothetical protein VHY91_16525 [Pirellulales bacterium]|jgi:hypothetical protein|nr:hypothetical protein [Pirellulales bacterium]